MLTVQHSHNINFDNNIYPANVNSNVLVFCMCVWKINTVTCIEMSKCVCFKFLFDTCMPMPTWYARHLMANLFFYCLVSSFDVHLNLNNYLFKNNALLNISELLGYMVMLLLYGHAIVCVCVVIWCNCIVIYSCYCYMVMLCLRDNYLILNHCRWTLPLPPFPPCSYYLQLNNISCALIIYLNKLFIYQLSTCP